MIKPLSMRTIAIVLLTLCLGAATTSFAPRDRGRPAPTADSTADQRRRIREARVSGPVSAPVEAAPRPARRGPADVNTLKYVLIDSKTRTATFIGRYDPAYATGPIPYADLLKDVLANPYPSFSLEPTTEARAQFDQVDKTISSDIARMARDSSYLNQWTEKLIALLLDDPSLAVDSRRLFINCGTALGMSGEELNRLYSASKGKVTLSGTEFGELTSKLMRGVGQSDVADAMLALGSGGTPEEIMRKMAEPLGLLSAFDELQKQAGSMSAEQLRNENVILCISAICRKLGAPESEIQSKVSEIRSGSSTSVLTGYMGDRMGIAINDKILAGMTNNVVLSPELLSRLYNLPVPQSDLVFNNVSADSQLGEVLFRADCRLKTLCTFPDAREQVPAHLTGQEFMQAEATAQNYDPQFNSGIGVGRRLAPADVTMSVSPGGDMIRFSASQVKVIAWVRETAGSGMDSKATEFVNAVTPKYGDFLTTHYDDYAKVYPEWHEMSEVAKLVALARWAKKNNYTINVRSESAAKVSLPKRMPGFWSAVLQAHGEATTMTVIQQGGASFSQDEGEDWLKTQQDATVMTDLPRNLVASAVLAGQAADAAINDPEAARELAELSAQAMTGEIDLAKLPSVAGIPEPGEPALYAAASAEVINQTSECVAAMDAAKKDLARADSIAATSPDEAATIRQQATQAQDNAKAKLKQLASSVSTYKTDPSKAGDTLAALQGNSPATPPPAGTVAHSPDPLDWSAQCSEWITQLDKVNQQIDSTQKVLIQVGASIQADRKQFEEWQKAAGDGIERCLGMIGDLAIDLCLGPVAERYDVIHELAKKLPGQPADVIEKYRYLASMVQRLKEAKATNDVVGLAKREGKTEAEFWETMRDGIGQISGLLGLDKTLPGQVWKYGSNLVDMTYNLTELYMGWKNVAALEQNNARYSESVKKLAKRMGELQGQAKDLRAKIAAGCDSATR